MAHFPSFINLENKKILILGAGDIAFNKVTRLLDFTSEITILSLDFSEKFNSLIKEHSLRVLHKGYEKGDIKPFDIVIAAIDNITLQEEIYKESRNYRCLYNCVDIPKYCDFIFPSYIKNEDLTIAISTSGSSPAVSKQLRIWLENKIPNNIGKFLKEMKEYRKTMPKGNERMKFLEQKAKDYFKALK